MKIDNGIIRLGFNPTNGSLIQITDLRNGMDYLSDPQQGRLFRVFAQDDEQWIDRYADSCEADPPEMRLQDGELSIHYPDLKIPGGASAGISATVRVSLPAGADEAIFTLELHNRSPHTISEVIFPWVGGWCGYPGERGVIQVGDHAPFDPFKNLRRNDGYNLANLTRKVNIGFPHVNVPMCDVTNGTVGLAFNFYPQYRDLNFDFFVIDQNEWLGDVRPGFGWVQRPFLEPGGQWKSGVVGIAPHSGDWHAAADKMRRWLMGWWRVPAPRAGLRGAIGFQNVYFRDFSGRDHRMLSEIPQIARYGLEHGIRDLLIWDMPLLGVYLRPGRSGLFEDRAERQAELRQRLEEVRRMGVRASPLINMRLGMQAHPFWKEHGERWAIRTYYDIPSQETLPLRKNTSMWINRHFDQGGVRFCQANPEFQEWALGNTHKILDLGFNAIFIDQPFSEDYCFSAQHGHRPGAAGHEGVCQWIARAADIVHAHSPDSYVIGEVPDIWNTQFFDLWWFWDWAMLRPEVFRYILPDSLQSWVIDAYDHPDQVGKAFAQGFLLNLNVRSLEKTLADVPDFAARVGQLAELRRKTYDFTLAGRFVDQQGLKIDTAAEITAAVYAAGEKYGIILGEGSTSLSGGGKVKLTLEPDGWGGRPVGELVLHRQDGSVQSLVASRAGENVTCEMEMGRWEAAALEVKLR